MEKGPCVDSHVWADAVCQPHGPAPATRARARTPPGAHGGPLGDGHCHPGPVPLAGHRQHREQERLEGGRPGEVPWGPAHSARGHGVRPLSTPAGLRSGSRKREPSRWGQGLRRAAGRRDMPAGSSDPARPVGTGAPQARSARCVSAAKAAAGDEGTHRGDLRRERTPAGRSRLDLTWVPCIRTIAPRPARSFAHGPPGIQPRGEGEGGQASAGLRWEGLRPACLRQGPVAAAVDLSRT